MRYGIFGDIHGNYDALEVVLNHLKKETIDFLICTGDIVGYGAEPCKCVETLREMNTICLAGNHDHAAVGKLDTEMFNIYAKRAAQWTKEQLTPDQHAYLANLPFVFHFPTFTVVHGSAHSPEEFHYISDIFHAELSFENLDTPVLFHGHTHIPMSFFDTVPMTYTMDHEVVIDPNSKTLINVGSVGQPRDEDPRASCCIYDDDTKTAHIYRLDYDVAAAGKKIIKAGLPEALAARLAAGK